MSHNYSQFCLQQRTSHNDCFLHTQHDFSQDWQYYYLLCLDFLYADEGSWCGTFVVSSFRELYRIYIVVCVLCIHCLLLRLLNCLSLFLSCLLLLVYLEQVRCICWCSFCLSFNTNIRRNYTVSIFVTILASLGKKNSYYLEGYELFKICIFDKFNQISRLNSMVQTEYFKKSGKHFKLTLCTLFLQFWQSRVSFPGKVLWLHLTKCGNILPTRGFRCIMVSSIQEVGPRNLGL